MSIRSAREVIQPGRLAAQGYLVNTALAVSATRWRHSIKISVPSLQEWRENEIAAKALFELCQLDDLARGSHPVDIAGAASRGYAVEASVRTIDGGDREAFTVRKLVDRRYIAVQVRSD